jgi:type I restriction enzyme S subunit
VLDVTINQDMKAFIPNTEKTNSVFLKNFFQCSSSYLLGKVRAVTADNIEFNQIKEFSFPLVPIEIQNQFAERVQAIEAQKQQAQLELAKSEELFQSLLLRAFKGELN